jgi:uncharacterized protein
MNYFFNLAVLFFALFAISCGNNYTAEEKQYIDEIEQKRSEKNDYMKSDPGSPFNARSKVEFSPLKYYKANPRYVFESKLYEYGTKDTITVFGTKGEERKVVRYGYLLLSNDEENFKVNVYEGTTKTGEVYHSIWFTDKTTGDDTYGVGRYIDFTLEPDEDFIYTVDFNLAYNPYCAYSSDYSCVIPLKDDHINLYIKAGEKNFH